MAVLSPLFLDTTLLLAGLIDAGEASDPAQKVLAAVARRRLPRPMTAWHCCLEFYAVATRLPEGFRLDPQDALRLLEEEVLRRLDVLDLPPAHRETLLRGAAQEGVAGGRIYDAHIAEIAWRAGARTVVTDNVRHFASLRRLGIRVQSAREFVRETKL